MKIQNQQSLPERVQAWVESARQNDQSKGDRNPAVDRLDWSGPEPSGREGLVRARGSFDQYGPRKLDLTVSNYDLFWRSEIKVTGRRTENYEEYTVRQRHHSDPEAFDFRASFRRNLVSGEVENMNYRPGPATGVELVRELLNDRTSLAVMAGTGLVTGAIGYAAGGGGGLAAAAAVGILAAGAFVAGNNLV